jgi:hypothetical protein
MVAVDSFPWPDFALVQGAASTHLASNGYVRTALKTAVEGATRVCLLEPDERIEIRRIEFTRGGIAWPKSVRPLLARDGREADFQAPH